jgi:hypothetical protein
MNNMQKLSQKILTDRLKLQMGIALSADIDLRTLQAMNRQLHNERLLEAALVEVSHGNSKAA